MTETEQLAQLLEERHEGLSQLLFLSRRQIELIEHGDLGTLLKVLGAKQQLLTTLQDVERRLDPFRDQQPDQRKWANPESREKYSQLADSSNRLLGEIFQLEKQSAAACNNAKTRRPAACKRCTRPTKPAAPIWPRRTSTAIGNLI